MPNGKKKVVNVKRKVKPARRANVPAKKAPRAKSAVMPRSVLDPAGMAYAKLLRDPCNSRPVAFYPGTAGYVQRFSSTFSVGTSYGGCTAGMLDISPGNGGQMRLLETVGENTVLSAINQVWSDASRFPGYAFLNSSVCSGFRVLACCAKIFTNANEAARTGFVFYGNLSVAELPVFGNTVAQLETLVPISTRTPEDQDEVRWFPGTGDTQYVTFGTDTPNKRECQSIAIGWSGQPPAIGFKVLVTAIVEWLPNTSVGLVESAMQPPASNNTLDHIKRALFNSSPSWWHQAGKTFVRVAASSLMSGNVVSGLRALTL